VHLRLRLLGDLSDGVAVAGDARVGAGLSGSAHDVGERGVGGRFERRFLSGDGLVVWALGGGRWRGFLLRGVGLWSGWLLDLAGQRDFIEGVR
jgi:hypothetical protein